MNLPALVAGIGCEQGVNDVAGLAAVDVEWAAVAVPAFSLGEVAVRGYDAPMTVWQLG